MVSCDEIKDKILNELDLANVVVTNPRGDDTHFRIEVQHPSFKDLNKLQQHRKTYEILGNNFNKCGQSLHTIELKTSY